MSSGDPHRDRLPEPTGALRNAAVLGVLVVGAGVFAFTGRGGDRTAPPETSASVPVVNFGRVDEGLYRGAQTDEAGLNALRDLGVRTVVNLRLFHGERELVERCGLEAFEMPLIANADSKPPTDAEIRTFLGTVTDPARRPAYVHCAHGKDRTGTMIAVYRMEVDGWTNERALEEMRSYGFHEVYGDLAEFVRGYRPKGAWRRAAAGRPE